MKKQKEYLSMPTSSNIFNIESEDVKHLATVQNCIDGALKIQELAKSGNASLATGLKTIDEFMGFINGELILMGGFPGSGKSTLVQQIALNVAMRDESVVLASYEVFHEDIGVNLISNIGEIDSHIWRMKELSLDDKDKATLAINKLSQIPLYIMDNNPTPEIIDSAVNCINTKTPDKKVKLIIIDYLNIMPSRGEKSKENVEQNMKCLLQLAKKYRVPIIAITALNREAIKRDIPLSKLSDLRDSSELEYGAGKVIIIRSDVSEERKNKNSNHNKMYLDLIKSRNSATLIGVLSLNFYPQYHKITD